MNLQKQTIWLFLLVVSLIIVSCRSNDTGSDLNKETVSVKVNISGSQYTDTSIRKLKPVQQIIAFPEIQCRFRGKKLLLMMI